MDLTGKKRIAVFGGSDCGKKVTALAEETGKLLASSGAIVYCGGGGGVMRSVCKGVWEVEGIVVGILPSSHISDMNTFVSIPVATGAGQGRNVMIANSVHGAIAIDGAYGTLSEIAHTLAQDKPVVTLGSWDIRGVNEVKSPEKAVKKIMELT